jgi:hypothetical protein
VEKPLVVDAEEKAPAEEEAPAEEASAEEAPIADTAVTYWNACVAWANSIKNATSDLDIPPDLLSVLYMRYKKDLYKHTYNYLSVFSWMFENIKLSEDYDDDTRNVYLGALWRVLLELVWDEHLTNEEQKKILKEPRTEDIKTAAAEQLIKRGEKEIFRSVSLATGKIDYTCDNDARCSEILIRTLESDRADPYNSVHANNTTTGPIYGFLIPKIKDARIVFKTNDRQVSPGVQPEKGGECEIVSSIETHKKGLRAIRDMITGAALKYPPFLLSDSVLNEKEIRGTLAKKEKVEAGLSVYKKAYTAALETGVPEEEAKKLGTTARNDALKKSPERFKIETKLSIDSRKFQNVIKACALKNIILRLIDLLEKEKGQKRYFYRPISAMKSNHRLK